MRRMTALTIVSVIAIALIVASCDPKLTSPIGTGSLGSLVPQGQPVRYVAVGNSLTAGYMDAALFESGQRYSFPYLIAQQLGADDFQMPWIADPGIGNRRFFRGFTPDGSPIVEAQRVQSDLLNANLQRPYNNLGVPGAILFDAIDTSDYVQRGEARGNPYYQVVLRSNQLGASMLDQAIALQPNVVTFWLGNNDVLGYATSGGTRGTGGTPEEPMPTAPAQFQALYAAALQKLTTALPDAKILVLNIPDVAAIPYFTTIPWNALVLTSQEQVDALNQAYGQLGFHFALGPNGFVAESKSSPYGIKQLTAKDLVLLSVPRDSLKAGWGSIKPIPDEYVLDSAEIAVVRQHLQQYNATIRNLANQFPNVYLIDAYQLFEDIKANGYFVPGSNPLTTSYLSGSFFSLDGVHPTPKGYGVVANEILKFINEQFGADIPLIAIQNLPAIQVMP